MIGTQLGPYRIHSELGTGGMGTVYLAEVAEAAAGLDPGQQIALKIVHAHLMETPGFFKRFLQEAELGKRVRHVNVVRTFDVDALAHEGKLHHYMVMEHVAGKSLRGLLLELKRVPENLLREVALQASDGLAAIHREGIVHRDIKPENVLITDAEEIRIMDLGVAKLQEATLAITKDGQFAGSLLYAAPEQFGRGPVGPPADLYALGVMLYELATGENPFRSDDAAGVMRAHLSEDPPKAVDRNENLSTFFSEVLSTLLAKAPGARFESAEALHSVLEEGERSSWWLDRAPAVEWREARLPRVRVNRETALHGRDGDLQLLEEAWGRAREGVGGTLFLTGEAGIGKTRLLDAFLRLIVNDEMHVLYGSYPPSGGIGGFSEAILGKFGEAGLGAALAPYLTVTPSLVPAFAALIRHESAPSGAEPLQGDALQAVVVHLMRGLAAEKPTLWIVDDVQFAPPESRDLLLAMARAVEDHRILVVAASRPGLDLAAFSRLPNVQRVALGRLSPREVVHLLRDAFRSEMLAEKLGGKIAVKSDGVPYFIFELIRGLKEGQFIREMPDGTYAESRVIESIEVPSAVKDLIEHRMRDLTEAQRAILDVGAVAGLTFDPGLVAHVLEEKRVRVLRELAEIERRHGLVCGEENHVRFDQNQIQEVLYGDLMPDLRREYHTLLADAHAEGCAMEPVGEDALFLAQHYLRGSRPERVRPYLDSALDQLEKTYRNDLLLEISARALELPGLITGRERVALLLRYAIGLDLLGMREKQRAVLDEAVLAADATESPALRSKARRSLGACLNEISQHGAAATMLAESIECALRAEDGLLECRARATLGLVLYHLGRYEEAQEQLERGATVARESGDREGEAAATGNLGLILRALGRVVEAREHHERCRKIAVEIGHRRGEATATANLGIAFMDLGRYKEAQEHHERCREIARTIGHRKGEAGAATNLGVVHVSLGEYESACESFLRAIALDIEVGDRHGEGISRLNLGTVQTSLGQNEEARATLDSTLPLLREIKARRPEGYLLSALGNHAVQIGDPEQARRFYQEALALRREISYASGIATTLIALGSLDQAEGDIASATVSLGEALSLARETGSPGAILSALVALARLPGGDTQAALAAYTEHAERVDHAARMDACFRLWELTGERAHLEMAHQLLTHLRDHAPPACRESMIENVPLHREITRALA